VLRLDVGIPVESLSTQTHAHGARAHHAAESQSGIQRQSATQTSNVNETSREPHNSYTPDTTAEEVVVITAGSVRLRRSQARQRRRSGGWLDGAHPSSQLHQRSWPMGHLQQCGSTYYSAAIFRWKHNLRRGSTERVRIDHCNEQSHREKTWTVSRFTTIHERYIEQRSPHELASQRTELGNVSNAGAGTRSPPLWLGSERPSPWELWLSE